MIHINEIGNYVALDATSVSYLRWIASPHRQIKIGDPAFAMCNERKGYLRGRFFGKLYRSHIIVFYLSVGRWPVGVIDHIDGNTKNNNPSNLREITSAQNLQNTKKAKGFSKTSSGKYKASIKNPSTGKYEYLGSFLSEEEAHAVYIEAKKRLHPFYIA